MIQLKLLTETFNIYQLKPEAELPSAVFSCNFYSITKTIDEVSVITDQFIDYPFAKSNPDWKGFKVDGILDFSLTGIINDITKPLKENGISVFVLSTYNTDYIFVKADSLAKSIQILGNTETILIGNE
jgi:uncharacterized protein